MKTAIMKTLVRVGCVLIVALSGGCGGGGGGGSEPVAVEAPAADARLVMDTMAWDQGDWSD
jgi:hypothetical protein